MKHLFFNSKGQGAVVAGRIDWDSDPCAKFAAVTRCSSDLVAVTSLYEDQCLHGVYFSESLCVSGARFITYQLPGVADGAVTACVRDLNFNRDVVGKIHKVKIQELVRFVL